MSDVRDVYITREVADLIGLNTAYLIRLAKKIGLNESEMREAGRRNYLFSKEAVNKLRNAKTE